MLKKMTEIGTTIRMMEGESNMEAGEVTNGPITMNQWQSMSLRM